MNIIVDAFGGDNSPIEVIKGCAMAVSEYDVNILLVGSKKKIEKIANENSILLYHIDVFDVEDVIGMDEDPAEIMKSKNNSTMAQGLKLLAQGKGDAFISAGNSGALVMGATFIVKRIKGVKRCAFAPILPRNEGCFMLIDSGANVECRPDMLNQFGIMGSIYMEKVMGIKSPRVALANIGTEEHKGGTFQHEAYNYLKNSNINFIGNIEARDIPDDAGDVIVTDGFTGNIILKLYEGVAMTLMSKIKSVLKKNVKTKLAAAMILPEMKELKEQLDYNEYGGAPIMGLSKPVFKAHGNSTAITFKNAIKVTMEYVSKNVINEIKEEIESMSEKKIEN